MGPARRRRALSLVVLGALVAPLSLLATPRAGPADENAPKAAPRKALRLPGRVEAAEQVQLYARVVGFVRRVQADIGDRVKKGQVLAELALPEVEAELKQKQALVVRAEAVVQHARQAVEESKAAVTTAKAAVSEAQAGVRYAQVSLDVAQDTLKRYKGLGSDKVVTPDIVAGKARQAEAAKAAVEQAEAKVQAAKASIEAAVAHLASAEAEVKVAEAGLMAARAEVEGVQARLGYAQVRAPFDGVVTRHDTEVGDLAGPSRPEGRPLFIVTRINPVRVVVAVPEADVPFVRIGTKVIVEVGALRVRKFTGKITRMAPVLDPRTSTMRVEIDLPNADGRLFPGMSAVVLLTSEKE